MNPQLSVTPDLPRIRRIFDDAGYSGEQFVRLFGPIELPTAASGDFAHFDYLTREPGPLNTLCRLFLVGLDASAKDAAAAFAPLGLEAFARAGLIDLRGDRAIGTVKLLLFRGFLLVSDHVDRMEAAERPEQVMGITDSTATLADSIPEGRQRSVLDLGTGSGAIAFCAASESSSVTGTDISERALAFARFSAALNSVRNIEFLAGSGFEPVGSRRFSLILSNPPFVVSPGRRYTYRDSGMEGDEFCRRLVRDAPRFLEEGGRFQMTCEWIHPAGGDWQERVTGWFEGSGCDAWVLKLNTQRAADYARCWIRDTEKVDAAEKSAIYEDWMRYAERSGIDAVSTGLVLMRKRSGANWVRMEEAPETFGPFGASIDRHFAAQDYLSGISDAALLEARPALNSAARLEQECEAIRGKWVVSAATLRTTRGLRFTANVDQRVAWLLAAADGSKTTRELVAGLAAALHREPSQIEESCLRLVRDLTARTFLLPG